MPLFLAIWRLVGGDGSLCGVLAAGETAEEVAENLRCESTEVVICRELNGVAPEFVAFVIALANLCEEFDEGMTGLLSMAVRAGEEIGKKAERSKPSPLEAAARDSFSQQTI